MKKYCLQTKNGHLSGWRDHHSYDDIKSAAQACEQIFKNYRGKGSTKWYKTRVIDENGIRVYPPQKKPGE